MNIKQIHVESILGVRKPEWFEFILDKICYNPLTGWLRHFIRFVKRLPKYTKLAWNNEDWDYLYLYDLIEMKLKEFKKAAEEDTWHTDSKRRVKEINLTLMRLDRWRNWTEYYDYPIDDIIHVPTEDGMYRMVHLNEDNEKQRSGAHLFEEKNYNKFWKNFMRWHQGWWT